MSRRPNPGKQPNQWVSADVAGRFGTFSDHMRHQLRRHLRHRDFAVPWGSLAAPARARARPHSPRKPRNRHPANYTSDVQLGTRERSDIRAAHKLDDADYEAPALARARDTAPANTANVTRGPKAGYSRPKFASLLPWAKVTPRNPHESAGRNRIGSQPFLIPSQEHAALAPR